MIMADGMLNKFVNFFKFKEDDDYEDEDDYDDYSEADEETSATAAREKEQVQTQPERVIDRKVEKSSPTRPAMNGYTEVASRRGRQPGEPVSNVVPIQKTHSGLEVCIMQPHSFEDSDKVCDALLSGHAVVINLEGFDTTQAQRIIDFVSGAIFAIEGKFYPISRYIFICSPGNVDISQDVADLSKSMGKSLGITIDNEF